MAHSASRLLDHAELIRQLSDLPGVGRGAPGSLVLAARAPSFEEAVQLVRLVSEDAERMNHHPDIDLRWCTLTFTLSTHSAGGVTQLDVELAHQILAAAAAVGAEVLPVPDRVEIALDAVDIDAVRPFWAAGLGYRGPANELGPPDGRGPVLWFQRLDPDAADAAPRRAVRGKFHLDVYVPDDEAPRRVQACLDAGGLLVNEAFAPSWWVLADPEGNELCVCTRREAQ
jgi:4a-hydroxytetrahydrobiopterin dehydratase